jgi:DNA-binding GntR family transcriptional regulator
MAGIRSVRSSVPAAKGRKQSPYERIKEAIVRGDLAPGNMLVETALAEWCEVSRTPIREALTRLEQDGMVIRSDRGLIVRERSHEEILDIYETRIVLEGTAARVAAARRSAVDIIHLRRIADAMDRVKLGDEDQMVSTNHDFHGALWRASHNESLTDLLTRLDLHIARYPSTTLSQPGRWDEAKREHREILDAIEAQDLPLAEDLARKHFAKARDLRLTILSMAEAESDHS